MFTCELDVASLEALVKAAKVAQLPKVKFLGFMGTAESGKEFMDILAEPCAPYVRAGESQREPTAPPTHW
jgi:hypothetical protein